MIQRDGLRGRNKVAIKTALSSTPTDPTPRPPAPFTPLSAGPAGMVLPGFPWAPPAAIIVVGLWGFVLRFAIHTALAFVDNLKILLFLLPHLLAEIRAELFFLNH